MSQAFAGVAMPHDEAARLAWLARMIEATTPDDVGEVILDLARTLPGVGGATLLWPGDDGQLQTMAGTSLLAGDTALAAAALQAGDGLQSSADGRRIALRLLLPEQVALLLDMTIEAPTGTGKSMAYLIAGVEVARFQKKKLLIATATVALQEQLVQRDIPLYLQLNGIEAKVALAKGRGRYLCPRNLLMAANSINDTAQMGLAGFDADLVLWAKPPQARDKQSLAKLRSAFDRNEWNGDMDSAPEPVSDLL
jgi:Rad3-related DNA helicase